MATTAQNPSPPEGGPAPEGESSPVPPVDEHRESAVAAGLRYVTDTMGGIRRKRVGRGVSYLRPDGSRVRDAATLNRIRALVIPPAWTDVWICPFPEGHIQVTARDAKGRKQYRYHPTYRAVRDETKFGRMLEFSELLPGIREHLEHDLALPGLPRPKLLATVVWLLERTFIRVGNDEYARDNRSYGLTTMRRRHLTVSGWRMDFEFRGKSGVRHAVAVTDRRIARIIQHCQSLPGEELFQYLDEEGKRQSVDSGDINEYLQISGREVTAKDFRTWAGTMLAASALCRLGPAPTEKQAKANIIAAVDEVARRLGNTRAVCRKYYVHPAILSAYLEGHVAPIPPDPPSPARDHPAASIRRDEAIVLNFIQSWGRTTA